MVGLHLGLLALVSFADLTAGMILFHLFTFDPEWLPSDAAERTEWIFYDGDCALCHGWVRFVLAEDRAENFRFSALQGKLFASRVQNDCPPSLYGSLVVVTDEEKLQTRSGAVLHILRRLGGLWLVLAKIVGMVPRGALDWCYDRVASVRKRLIRKHAGICPVLGSELRARFAE
jgi:predicted DCC family thiol-disulfide oxidoreductase YuxK